MKKLFCSIILSLLPFVVHPLLAMEDPVLTPEFGGIPHKAPTWEFLEYGDRIAIIAPSGAPLNPEHVGAIKEPITQQGLYPFLPEGAINKEASRHGYYANNDEERTAYFIEALQNFKALWALRGGFGAMEVVELLARCSHLPPKEIKLLIGFSDITALHLLAATWGWPSLHGPVIGLGEELYPVTQVNVNKCVKLSSIFPILKGDVRELEYSFEVIHPGSLALETPILGSVMGGNLSIIENHKGTPTALNGKGRFVFFEDTPEDGKRFSRRLLGLISAGIFDEARGIIVGNNPITGFEDSSQEIKDLMKYFVKQFFIPRNINIPVVYSPRFGHGEYNDVMPLGTIASLCIHGEQATLKVSVNESAYK